MILPPPDAEASSSSPYQYTKVSSKKRDMEILAKSYDFTVIAFPY